MRKFAAEYPDSQFVQQAVAQLPWGHLVTIMYSVSDEDERMFYINEARTNGWSRNILSMQIETNLFKRQGNAVTNFNDKLTSPQSDLAQNIVI